MLWFVCLLLFNINVNSFENKILLKVNNEIITSIDILNELKYLRIINKEFRGLDKEQTFKISKNSVIREKIKEIEIKKIVNEITVDDKILNNLLLNYFKEFKIKTISELDKFFLSNNINPDTIKKKNYN